MPFLGLFSKKDKSKSSSASRASASIISKEDDVEHTDAGFVLSPPSDSVPSLANGSFYGSSSNASVVSTGSSSKLKVPFKRRRLPILNSPLSASSYSISTSATHDPSTLKSVATNESSMSTSPSRSSVFPSFHSLDTPPSSTRSLPAAQHRPQPSPLQNDADHTVKAKSGGGLFGWKNRERKKSKATKPELDSLPSLPPAESFHLMSFRHIQAGSPNATSPKRDSLESGTTATPYVSPATRPRGDSMASADSSQRISVAAFREAQARRSSTNLARGSPSPQPTPRPISMANSAKSDSPPPRPPRAIRPPVTTSSPRDSKSSSAFSAVDSSTSESSSEEESDSEGRPPSRSRSRLSRQRTITKRSYRASSDLGHGSSNRTTHHQQTATTRSEVGHGGLASRTAHVSPSRGPPPSSFQKTANASVGTRSFSLYRRQRASYSTSELTPNAAAKRASVMAAANDRDAKDAARKSGYLGSDTSESDSGNGSSDEDAPLASLVLPKRPDSNASQSSPSASPVVRPKPLIDLNTKFNPINGKPTSGAPGTEEDKPRGAPILSPTNISERLAKVTASAGLTDAHRDTKAAKSEDNLTIPSRKSSLNWRELSLEEPEESDSPVSSGTVSPLPPRFRAQTSPMVTENTRVRTNSTSPAISPSKIETDVLPPIPIQGKPQDDVGFKVMSRPRKPSSSTVSPVTPTSFVDTPRTKESEVPVQVRYHRPHSTSFTVVSRPQSTLSSLDTKPLVVPQDETKNRTSAASVSPRSQTSQSPPQRPFTLGRRQESPSSSTGGSSNGKAPLTPNDGSDYFTPEVRTSGDSPNSSSTGVPTGMPSAMKGGRPRSAKRGSTVSFQDIADIRKEDKERGRAQSNATVRQEDISAEVQESRRKERRRSEAKAAIELGNVINGKIPLDDDEDDDDDGPVMGANMGPRMSMMNPMMLQNGMQNGLNFNTPVGWQQPRMSPQIGMGNMGNMGLNQQQFMIPTPPPNADQAYLAAHRQALMIAKQAYQYAVAQQAMAAAGEEWERGSSVSGFTPSAGMNGMGGMNFGMPGMNGMGTMPGLSPAMAGMWGGRPMFPPGPQSTYAGSNIGVPSEVGWGSASVYGENFGPSLTAATRRAQATNGSRKSAAGDLNGVAFPSSFQRSESSGNLNGSAQAPPVRHAPRQRTRTAPSNGRLPDQHSRLPSMPPSSWKVS